MVKITDTKDLIQEQEKIIRSGVAAGSAFLFGDDKGVTFENYAGEADAEAHTPVSEQTVFHMYSMTKVMTVVTALSLWEDGILDLDAPVGEYIPEYKELSVYDGGVRKAKNVMRVSDLFTMTSGLTYLNEYDKETTDGFVRSLGNGKPVGTVGFAKALAALPLMFEPGEQFRYGLSHDVLGAMIEILTGKTLDAVFKEKIFDPLGMADACFYQNADENTAKRLARNTAYENGKYINIPLVPRPVPSLCGINDRFIFSGGSGVVCTARDYAKFLIDMANGGGRLLKRQTVEMMTSPRLSPKQRSFYNNREFDPSSFGEEHTFALGVRVQDKISAQRSGEVGEWGWSGALGTWFFVNLRGDWFLYLHHHTPPRHGDYIIGLRKAYYDRRVIL